MRGWQIPPLYPSLSMFVVAVVERSGVLTVTSNTRVVHVLRVEQSPWKWRWWALTSWDEIGYTISVPARALSSFIWSCPVDLPKQAHPSGWEASFWPHRHEENAPRVFAQMTWNTTSLKLWPHFLIRSSDKLLSGALKAITGVQLSLGWLRVGLACTKPHVGPLAAHKP